MIGSMVVMSLHALVLSTAKMTRRVEVSQQALRGDLATLRAIRTGDCRSRDGGGATSADVRLVQRRAPSAVDGAPGARVTVAERRDGAGWRTVGAVGERCDLPERCAWDVVARACRNEGVGP